MTVRKLNMVRKRGASSRVSPKLNSATGSELSDLGEREVDSSFWASPFPVPCFYSPLGVGSSSLLQMLFLLLSQVASLVFS